MSGVVLSVGRNDLVRVIIALDVGTVGPECAPGCGSTSESSSCRRCAKNEHTRDDFSRGFRESCGTFAIGLESALPFQLVDIQAGSQSTAMTTMVGTAACARSASFLRKSPLYDVLPGAGHCSLGRT